MSEAHAKSDAAVAPAKVKLEPHAWFGLYLLAFMLVAIAAGVYALASTDWRNSNDVLFHLLAALAFFYVPIHMRSRGH